MMTATLLGSLLLTLASTNTAFGDTNTSKAAQSAYPAYPVMRANRFSDNVNRFNVPAAGQDPCPGSLACPQGFPWVNFFKQYNPNLFENYNKAMDHAYSPQVNKTNPVIANPKKTDQEIDEVFERLKNDGLATNLLLKSAVRKLVTGAIGLIPGVGFAATGVGAGWAAEHFDEKEKTTEQKNLDEAQAEIKRQLKVLRAEAGAADRKEFDETAVKYKKGLERLGALTQNIGKKKQQELRDLVDKNAPATRSNQEANMGDIWKEGAQEKRLSFEVARILIPPDQFYELALKGDIATPKTVTLESLKESAEKYVQSQEYKQIRAAVEQVQTVGNALIGLASKMGLDRKSAVFLQKTLAISMSVVMAFCPPTPVNIALSIVSIIGTLMSGGDDPTGAILQQIVQTQQDILVQIRYLRSEMQQNHEETMVKLQRLYAGMQFETMHIRSLLTDMIQRDVFSQCNSAQMKFSLWSREAGKTHSTKATYETFIADLEPTERKLFVTCNEKIESLLIGERPSVIQAYFQSAVSAVDAGLRRKERENTLPSPNEFAQNSFDSLVDYAEEALAAKNKSLDYMRLSLPGRNYYELKKKLKKDYSLPIAVSAELLQRKNFNLLLLPQSLDVVLDKTLFLSGFSSHIDLQGEFLPRKKIDLLVSKGKTPGFNKGVYESMSILRDLLAVSRAQQNLLTGDIFLPILWNNFNRGLSVLHLQRLMNPFHLGPVSSENYRDTLHIFEDSPLLATNAISWGIWELAQQSDHLTYSNENTLSLYLDAYQDASPDSLHTFFSQFKFPVTGFDQEDREILKEESTPLKVPANSLPQWVKSWGDPQLQLNCWTEIDLMTQISTASAKMREISKLDLIRPVVDLANPSKVLNQDEKERREKEVTLLQNKVVRLVEKLNTHGECPDPIAADVHKWYVKAPQSGQFIALPLPEKVLNFELYTTQAFNKTYELSEALERELFDYEWKFWTEFHGQLSK